MHNHFSHLKNIHKTYQLDNNFAAYPPASISALYKNPDEAENKMEFSSLT